jgi:hypothetical protein
MVTTLLAILEACFCSAFSAWAAFFWASLAARFWASRLKEAVAASRASGDQIWAYSVGCVFSSHSWHFLGVPPYSQYSGGRVQTRKRGKKETMSVYGIAMFNDIE